MDGRIWVPLQRPCRRAACGPRRGMLVLLLIWFALGLLAESQLRLPELDLTRPVPLPGHSRPAPAPRSSRAACWVVQVGSGPAPALRHGLRRLRHAGLPAAIRPGERSGTQMLVVRASGQASAHAVQARVARFGFSRSTVRALSGAVCRR